MTQAVTVKLELTLTFGLKVASSQVEISATVKPQEVTTKNIKVSKGGKAVNFSQQLQLSNRGNSARLAEYGVNMVQYAYSSCYTALRRTFRLTQVVATVGALVLMTQAVTVKLELTITR